MANLHDKEEYAIHKRKWKQSLNHGLILKKVRSVIKVNQEKCKRKVQKMISNKTFSSWWIKQFLEKTVENVRKHRDIKLVTTGARRNYLVSQPNYHPANFFSENLLAIEMKKKKKKNTDNMNEIVYLGLLIWE